jgi:hypothetical protein
LLKFLVLHDIYLNITSLLPLLTMPKLPPCSVKYKYDVNAGNLTDITKVEQSVTTFRYVDSLHFRIGDVGIGC